MRRVIWKYQLMPGDITQVKTPGPARPLAVGWQGEQLCLWCIVEPEQPEETFDVYPVMTGDSLPSNLGQYIGTAQSWFGIVAHVFTMSEEA